MKAIFSTLITLLVFSCAGQKQTFDIINYTPPKQWKKENSESAIQFTKQDEAKGTYCVITVMKSIPGSANTKENFDAAWETVVKEMVKVSTVPEMQPVANENGWEAQSGYAPFENDGTKGVALLSTSTGFGKMVKILILTNSDVYEKEMSAFLESVSFVKPAGANNTQQGNNFNGAQKNSPSKADGYTFNTTNFDDGWTSSIKEDWVEVTKDNTKVYLLFALPYDAANFSGTGMMARDYYWDNYVAKYFNIQTKQYQDKGEFIGSFKPKYVEGWAKDKQSGQKVFIAMTVSIAPGAAYINIASASDDASLRSRFPKVNDSYSSDLAAMSSYNKFSVDKNDLIGKWSSSGGGTMNWYSTTTGQDVGATGTVTADVFQFNANNTYTSQHNGASGWVGSMGTYQQKYNGAYTVSNWQVIATKRWDGKTETFDAWFEAAKGGRILHLVKGPTDTRLFIEK